MACAGEGRWDETKLELRTEIFRLTIPLAYGNVTDAKPSSNFEQRFPVPTLNPASMRPGKETNLEFRTEISGPLNMGYASTAGWGLFRT
jgi:hypothetical protein